MGKHTMGNQLGNPKAQRTNSKVKRRHVIGSSVIVAASLVGCVGGDDDDIGPVDDSDDLADVGDPDDVVDQAFTYPTTDNPETGSFVGAGGRYEVQGLGAIDTEYEYPWQVWPVMREPAAWGRVHHTAYLFQPGEVFYGTLEDIVVESDRIIYTLKDDLYWSDGEPVTALDGAAGQAIRRFTDIDENQYLYDREDSTHNSRFYDWIEFPDGKTGDTWQVVSQHEGLPQRWHEDTYTGYLWTAAGDDIIVQLPTHIEPFQSVVEFALDEMDRGLEDEPVVANTDEIWGQFIDAQTAERFRDPDEVITNGLWTLADIRGAEEWVLEPNEYHRHVDQLNFTEIRMPWIEEDHRLQAELQAERLDYAQHRTPEEITPDLLESYERELNVGSNDIDIIFDHTHPVWGEPKVRQAVAFALDTEAIAETYHNDLTIPVTVPGADWVGIETMVSESWIDDTLIDYSQDVERATQLMMEAGFERGTDDEWLHDGDPIEFVFPTDDDAPIWERIVVDQLNDFGFRGQVESMASDVYNEREDAGEFEIWGDTFWWSTNWLLGYAYFVVATADSWAIEHFGIYDIPEKAELVEEADGLRWETVADRYEIHYWMPPFGEPEGDLERWENLNDDIVRDFYRFGDESSPETQEETMKKVLWAFNWGLPVLQLFYPLDQHLYNDDNWHWPTEHPSWESLGFGVGIDDYLSTGMISADTDNPR